MNIQPAGTPSLPESNFSANLPKSSQRERIKEWESLYKQDYVAHGIVRANEKAVFEDGFLRCGENILRRKGRLEFEGGATSGSREIIQLPQQPLESKFLEPIKAKVVKLFEMSDQAIEEMIRDIQRSGRRNQSSDEEDFLADLTLSSQNADNLREAKNTYEDLITKLVRFKSLWKEGDKPRDVYIKTLVAIYIDKALPKDFRCKAQLARVFTIYERLVREKEVDVTMAEIGVLLGRIRTARFLDPGKINQEIRVFRNHHASCYGDVRILIGGAKESIGSEQISQTGEYCLLGIGQNKGKFFKIDLASPNVLIIGPESSLAPYAQGYPFSKNIVFTKNLDQSKN